PPPPALHSFPTRRSSDLGGEVARRAIAEPPRAESHVLILGDRELAARAAQVVAIGADLAREGQAVEQRPAVRAQQLLVGLALSRSEEHTSELQSLAYLVC